MSHRPPLHFPQSPEQPVLLVIIIEIIIGVIFAEVECQEVADQDESGGVLDFPLIDGLAPPSETFFQEFLFNRRECETVLRSVEAVPFVGKQHVVHRDLTAA